MFAEIAQLLLIFSFLLCVFYGLKGFWISFNSNDELFLNQTKQSVSRTSIFIGLLLFTCFLLLMQLFIVSDFSVLNVAENSNALLPIEYKIAATWGSHEGSFLLWIVMLAGWTCAVAKAPNELSNCFQIRVISVLLIIQSCFLAYLIFTSNPFTRVFPIPALGKDLNPLLQDPFMVIHPPMLYMGYVGFAICFAMAIAALLDDKISANWARWSRPWAISAWSFLTLGILLGSWWAYRELGWGGWWFWDPVENASLMPWFAGTALIHSLAVTDKRNTLKSWTILLSIIAFGFSLLGTFLVRSGVLTSVHSFASDPTRGIFILIMLVIILGIALFLYGLRTKNLGIGEGFATISKESLLVTNNIIMTSALAVVMLGTLYPLIAEVITGRKMSVGPPYFNTVIIPILLPALFLMSLAPWIIWKKSSLNNSLKNLLIPALFSFLFAAFFFIFYKKTNLLTALGIFGATILLLGTIFSVFNKFKQLKINSLKNKHPNLSVFSIIKKLGFSYWGMIIAHCGLAIFSFGVIFVMSYQIEKDLIIKPNQVQNVGSHTITLKGIKAISGDNFSGVEGTFELSSNDNNKTEFLYPQKRLYVRSADPMTEAAISYGVFGDFYLSLGEPTDKKNINKNTTWTIRASYKPLMVWVWFGCLLMAIGGMFAIVDKRYLSNASNNKKNVTENPKIIVKQ